jgi:hypothetical protein
MYVEFTDKHIAKKKWKSFMIVVLRDKTINKSPAVYRKIYVPSVVYCSNPTWRGKFSVSVITTLLMENWNDKTIVTDQFILLSDKLILHDFIFYAIKDSLI